MINLRPTSDINREYPLVKTNHTYDKALIIDPLFSFSLATLLLKKGTDLESIQKLIGPKSSKTTER
jgi:site-specific recombinase XerD